MLAASPRDTICQSAGSSRTLVPLSLLWRRQRVWRQFVQGPLDKSLCRSLRHKSTLVRIQLHQRGAGSEVADLMALPHSLRPLRVSCGFLAGSAGLPERNAFPDRSGSVDGGDLYPPDLSGHPRRNMRKCSLERGTRRWRYHPALVHSAPPESVAPTALARAADLQRKDLWKR